MIALVVRSSARAAAAGDDGAELPAPAAEFDYPLLLNKVLPQEIRVLGWTDAPPDFNARSVG